MFLNPIYGIEYGVYVHLYPFLDFDVELHTNAISPAFVRNGGTLEDLFFASYQPAQIHWNLMMNQYEILLVVPVHPFGRILISKYFWQ